MLEILRRIDCRRFYFIVPHFLVGNNEFATKDIFFYRLYPTEREKRKRKNCELFHAVRVKNRKECEENNSASQRKENML